MSWVWCWCREVYDGNVTQDFIETKWCFTEQQWVFGYDMESKTCSESSLLGRECLPRCSNHCDIAQSVFPMSRQTAQHQVASRVTHTDNPQTNDKDRHHYYISKYIPQNYNKALENRRSQKRTVVSKPPFCREYNGYQFRFRDGISQQLGGVDISNL